MKKLSVVSTLLAIVMFFVIGCTTGQGQPQIQIDPEDQAVIAKIAGRHAGNELAKRYPDVAAEIAKVCNKIVVEDNPDIVVTLGKSMIMVLADDQIKDSLLKADIADILDMIKVESGVAVTEEQLIVIKAVAEGLISGIEIAE